MADAPFIKYSGQGSRREAARLSETISSAASSGLAGWTRPVNIDWLQVQAPAGCSRAELERAIRIAIERKLRRGR